MSAAAAPMIHSSVKVGFDEKRHRIFHLESRLPEVPEPPLHKFERKGDERRHSQNERNKGRSITGWSTTSSSAGFARYAQAATWRDSLSRSLERRAEISDRQVELKVQKFKKK
ncbi:hypothetical protein BGW80DRAFT_1442348 [Lactifluus volemus]|nr:hypothetical protein BGW80DRAFT_1442348 [Lactifluus volemus]